MTEPTTRTVPVEFLRGVITLCTQRGYSPENIEAWSKDDKWVADLWRKAEQMLAIAKWGTPAPVGVEPVTADSVLEDAARYRWLRERSSTMFVNISINGEGAEIAATLDSAVDAARAAQKEGEKP